MSRMRLFLNGVTLRFAQNYTLTGFRVMLAGQNLYGVLCVVQIRITAGAGLTPPGRRWCTRQIQGEMAPNPKLLRDDRLATDGIRAPGGQHPVQHRHADGSLSLLGREAAGSQTRSDQRLVTTHRRFH